MTADAAPLAAIAGSSPGDPLPSQTRTLAVDPRRSLARLAADLDRLALRRPWPRAWERAGFGREVELVRRHLAPIRSRPLLASSFGREGLVLRPVPGDPAAQLAASPTAVAYAIRWSELGQGRDLRPWPACLGDDGSRRSHGGSLEDPELAVPADAIAAWE